MREFVEEETAKGADFSVGVSGHTTLFNLFCFNLPPRGHLPPPLKLRQPCTTADGDGHRSRFVRRAGGGSPCQCRPFFLATRCGLRGRCALPCLRLAWTLRPTLPSACVDAAPYLARGLRGRCALPTCGSAGMPRPWTIIWPVARERLQRRKIVRSMGGGRQGRRVVVSMKARVVWPVTRRSPSSLQIS